MRLGRNMGCGLSRLGLARKRTHPADQNLVTTLKRGGEDGDGSGALDDGSSMRKRSSGPFLAKADDTEAQKQRKSSKEPDGTKDGGDAREGGRSLFSKLNLARSAFTTQASRCEGSKGPAGETEPITDQTFMNKLKHIQATKAKGPDGWDAFMETTECAAATESQIEFFRKLDEKIAQGRDYIYSPSCCS